MNAGKPLIWALIALLLIPVVAIVAAVGLISQILGADSTACTALTTPGPVSAGGAGGSFLATAYGPPWDAMNGSGVTATGINLTAGQPALVIAVDPAVIPLRTLRARRPQPVRHQPGVLRRRHRRGDHRPARRHLRLARPRRPIRVGRPAGHRHRRTEPGHRPAARRDHPDRPHDRAARRHTGCPVAVSGPLPLTPGAQATILPDGLAAAPADAPPAVKAAIAAGNQLIDKPYIYGGGHGTPLTELAAGYDCSGSTSYVPARSRPARPVRARLHRARKLGPARTRPLDHRVHQLGARVHRRRRHRDGHRPLRPDHPGRQRAAVAARIDHRPAIRRRHRRRQRRLRATPPTRPLRNHRP